MDYYVDDYKRKNVGACICLFCIQAYHSLEENRQRNTHAEVYRCTVKCACEDMDSPRSTLRSLIYTPRGVTPAMFLSSFRCGSSNTQKQSVSNAFPICSAPPCSSAHLSMHHSHYRQIAGTKVQILFVNIRP